MFWYVSVWNDYLLHYFRIISKSFLDKIHIIFWKSTHETIDLSTWRDTTLAEYDSILLKIIWWYEWLMHLYFSTARIQKYLEIINRDIRWSEYRSNSSFLITYAKWLQSSININLLYLCHWRRFGVSSAWWCDWQWIRELQKRVFIVCFDKRQSKFFFSFQVL